MKAAVLHRYDPELRNKEFLVYEEIDDPPAPGPGEVIVKIQEKFTVSGRESVSSKLEIKYCVIRFFLPG